jgi:hypothetical protein
VAYCRFLVRCSILRRGLVPWLLLSLGARFDPASCRLVAVCHSPLFRHSLLPVLSSVLVAVTPAPILRAGSFCVT